MDGQVARLMPRRRAKKTAVEDRVEKGPRTKDGRWTKDAKDQRTDEEQEPRPKDLDLDLNLHPSAPSKADTGRGRTPARSESFRRRSLRDRRSSSAAGRRLASPAGSSRPPRRT